MRAITGLIGALLTAAVAHGADRGAYPTRPVRFIVAFAPAGGTDIVARSIAARLTEMWGQQIVVDNRPGAGTIIGTELAARSPADGYTMLLASSSYGINPALHAKLPYDPLKDLVPVVQTAFQPYVFVVHPSVAARTVQEFIALARSKPDTMSFGSPGTGSGGHLGVELFKMVTGIAMVHVPYRGGAPALADLLGGQIQVMFPTILTVKPHIASGRLRSLAVTGAKRSASLPDIPTVSEAGVPGFAVESWNGVMVPAGVAAGIIAKMNRDIVVTLRSADVRNKLTADGAEPAEGSARDFGRLIAGEIEKWSKVVKSGGVKVD